MDIQNNLIRQNEDKSKPLKDLTIDGYKYKLKDIYSNGYCFRCMFKATCKLTILILFSEYSKLIDSKDKKTKIKYTINSK